ncbi:MAG: cysteine peptidase family C39 domain-containing protein, partial [Candidatus Omnitrophota bacterium]
MLKQKLQTEDWKVTQEKSKEKFHSSFKAWIRVVAFIVAAVFLPEQVAQAVEYDWRVLWNKPAIGLSSNSVFSPNYLKNVQNINIPQAIKSILKDISNKPINAIKISDNLTIKLDKPLEMSNQRIDELYNWLLGKPCGSKALYDYLNYKGVKVDEQDIAVVALTVDILNDVVKPEGNPKVIKNSLYALSQAAEFFGQKLYPAKLSANNYQLIANLAPFIAHLNGDHYVLVTRVSEDKVYFSDEHKENFLPQDKFFGEFSGYCLVSKLTDDLQVLTPAESKKILGAGSSWKRHASDDSVQYNSNKMLSSLDSEISSLRSSANRAFVKDLSTSIGSAILMSSVSSVFSGSFKSFSSGMASSFNGVSQGLVNGSVTSLVSNLFSYTKMNQRSAELCASYVSGAILGAAGGLDQLTNGLQGPLQRSISGGLTSLATTYATRLASDSGIKSSVLSIFIGNVAGLAVNSAVNGAFYKYNGQYVQSVNKVTGDIHISIAKSSDLMSKSYSGAIWNYSKAVWSVNKNNLLSGLVANGAVEIVTRHPEILGLSSKDLDNLPYASAISSIIQGAVGASFNKASLSKEDWASLSEAEKDRASLSKSIYRALLSGVLTVGAAKIEAEILKRNSGMTAVMAAYLSDAGTALIRGLAESILSPTGKAYKPESIGRSVIDTVTSALSQDSLDALSMGYIGRNKSILGEIAYVHTLTSTFAPRTQEILRQQMASSSYSGTAVGDGSTVNLTLSDGTVATLSLKSDSEKIKAFMSNDVHSGLKYEDAAGNTWVSNGNGTFSLYSESSSNQESSFVAGWSQIAHDIYQAGAVRNMTGIVGTVSTFRKVFGLPLSFMTTYRGANNNLQAGRFTEDVILNTGREIQTTFSIEDMWGNQVLRQAAGYYFSDKTVNAIMALPITTTSAFEEYKVNSLNYSLQQTAPASDNVTAVIADDQASSTPSYLSLPPTDLTGTPSKRFINEEYFAQMTQESENLMPSPTKYFAGNTNLPLPVEYSYDPNAVSGKLTIKANSLIVTDSQGAIQPTSKVTGWDIIALSKYAEGLSILVSSKESIAGVTETPASSLEKLTAVISKYKGNIATAAALLKLAYMRGDTIQLDGRSVYAAEGTIKLNSDEAFGMMLGINKATSSNEIVITNSTYQYVPQINHMISKSISEIKEEKRIGSTSSYSAYNVSLRVVKMEMRNANDSFSVNAFGAYMKPGDNIFVEKGLLAGIGMDFGSKSLIVLSGSNVVLNSKGRFSAAENKPSKIVIEKNALEKIGSLGGLLFKNIDRKSGINQIVYKEWLKGASSFETIDLFGRKIKVAGIETRENDSNTYAIGEINTIFERKISLPQSSESSDFSRIYLEDSGSRHGVSGEKLAANKANVIKEGYYSDVNNKKIGSIIEANNTGLTVFSLKDITFNEVPTPFFVSSIFDKNKELSLVNSDSPILNRVRLNINVNVIGEEPQISKEVGSSKRLSRSFFIDSYIKEGEKKGTVKIDQSYVSLTIKPDQIFSVDIPENIEDSDINKGFSSSLHLDENVKVNIPCSQYNDVINVIYPTRNLGQYDIYYKKEKNEDGAYKYVPVLPSYRMENNKYVSEFVTPDEYAARHSKEGGLYLNKRNQLVRDNKGSFQIISSGEITENTYDRLSWIKNEKLRNVLLGPNASILLNEEWKAVKVNSRAIASVGNNIGKVSSKDIDNDGKEMKISEFKGLKFIGKGGLWDGEGIDAGLSVRGIYTVLGGEKGTYYIDVNSYAPLLNKLSATYPELKQSLAYAKGNYQYAKDLGKNVAVLAGEGALTLALAAFPLDGPLGEAAAGAKTIATAKKIFSVSRIVEAAKNIHSVSKIATTARNALYVGNAAGALWTAVNAAEQKAATGEIDPLILTDTYIKSGKTATEFYLFFEAGRFLKTPFSEDFAQILNPTSAGALFKSALKFAVAKEAAVKTTNVIINEEKISKDNAKYISDGLITLGSLFLLGKANKVLNKVPFRATRDTLQKGLNTGVTWGNIKSGVNNVTVNNQVYSFKEAFRNNMNDFRDGFSGGFAFGVAIGALGHLANSTWATRFFNKNIGNPIRNFSENRFGKYLTGNLSSKLAQVNRVLVFSSIGAGTNIYLDYKTGKLNKSSTPGEKLVSGLKGAAYGLAASWLFSPAGLNYLRNNVLVNLKTYASEKTDLKAGLFNTTGLGIRGTGTTQFTLDVLEGAIKWPFVSAVMDMASPAWDTAIGAFEKGVDRAFGYSKDQPIIGWKSENGIYSIFKQELPDGGYAPIFFTSTGTALDKELSFFTQKRYKDWIEASECGAFLGPVIKIFSRQPVGIYPGNKIEALGAKLGGSPGLLSKTETLARFLASNDKVMGGYNLGPVASFISKNSVLAEIDSLIYVSGFVTGIDRAMRLPARVGLYWDTLRGNIEKSGNIEHILPRYAGVSFSEKERSGWGWGMLFVKPSVRPADGFLALSIIYRGDQKGYKNTLEGLRQGKTLNEIISKDLSIGKNIFDKALAGDQAQRSALFVLLQQSSKLRGILYRDIFNLSPEVSSQVLSSAVKEAKSDPTLDNFSRLSAFKQAIESFSGKESKGLTAALDHMKGSIYRRIFGLGDTATAGDLSRAINSAKSTPTVDNLLRLAEFTRALEFTSQGKAEGLRTFLDNQVTSQSAGILAEKGITVKSVYSLFALNTVNRIYTGNNLKQFEDVKSQAERVLLGLSKDATSAEVDSAYSRAVQELKSGTVSSQIKANLFVLSEMQRIISGNIITGVGEYLFEPLNTNIGGNTSAASSIVETIAREQGRGSITADAQKQIISLGELIKARAQDLLDPASGGKNTQPLDASSETIARFFAYRATIFKEVQGKDWDWDAGQIGLTAVMTEIMAKFNAKDQSKKSMVAKVDAALSKAIISHPCGGGKSEIIAISTVIAYKRNPFSLLITSSSQADVDQKVGNSIVQFAKAAGIPINVIKEGQANKEVVEGINLTTHKVAQELGLDAKAAGGKGQINKRVFIVGDDAQGPLGNMPLIRGDNVDRFINASIGDKTRTRELIQGKQAPLIASLMERNKDGKSVIEVSAGEVLISRDQLRKVYHKILTPEQKSFFGDFMHFEASVKSFANGTLLDGVLPAAYSMTKAIQKHFSPEGKGVIGTQSYAYNKEFLRNIYDKLSPSFKEEFGRIAQSDYADKKMGPVDVFERFMNSTGTARILELGRQYYLEGSGYKKGGTDRERAMTLHRNVTGYSVADNSQAIPNTGTIFGDNIMASALYLKHHAAFDKVANAYLHQSKEQITYTEVLDQAGGFILLSGTTAGMENTFSAMGAKVIQVKSEPNVVDAMVMGVFRSDGEIYRAVDRVVKNGNKKGQYGTIVISDTSAQRLIGLSERLNSKYGGEYGEYKVTVIYRSDSQFDQKIANITEQIKNEKKNNPSFKRIVLVQGLVDGLNILALPDGVADPGKLPDVAVIKLNPDAKTQVGQTTQRASVLDIDGNRSSNKRMFGDAYHFVNVNDIGFSTSQRRALIESSDKAKTLVEIEQDMVHQISQNNVQRLLLETRQYSLQQVEAKLADYDMSYAWSKKADKTSGMPLSVYIGTLSQEEQQTITKLAEDREWVKQGYLTQQGKVVFEQAQALTKAGAQAAYLQNLGFTVDEAIVNPSLSQSLNTVENAINSNVILAYDAERTGISSLVAMGATMEKFGVKNTLAETVRVLDPINYSNYSFARMIVSRTAESKAVSALGLNNFIRAVDFVNKQALESYRYANGKIESRLSLPRIALIKAAQKITRFTYPRYGAFTTTAGSSAQLARQLTSLYNFNDWNGYDRLERLSEALSGWGVSLNSIKINELAPDRYLEFLAKRAKGIRPEIKKAAEIIFYSKEAGQQKYITSESQEISDDLVDTVLGDNSIDPAKATWIERFQAKKELISIQKAVKKISESGISFSSGNLTYQRGQELANKLNIGINDIFNLDLNFGLKSDDLVKLQERTRKLNFIDENLKLLGLGQSGKGQFDIKGIAIRDMAQDYLLKSGKTLDQEIDEYLLDLAARNVLLNSSGLGRGLFFGKIEREDVVPESAITGQLNKEFYNTESLISRVYLGLNSASSAEQKNKFFAELQKKEKEIKAGTEAQIAKIKKLVERNAAKQKPVVQQPLSPELNNETAKQKKVEALVTALTAIIEGAQLIKSAEDKGNLEQLKAQANELINNNSDIIANVDRDTIETVNKELGLAESRITADNKQAEKVLKAEIVEQPASEIKLEPAQKEITDAEFTESTKKDAQPPAPEAAKQEENNKKKDGPTLHAFVFGLDLLFNLATWRKVGQDFGIVAKAIGGFGKGLLGGGKINDERKKRVEPIPVEKAIPAQAPVTVGAVVGSVSKNTHTPSPADANLAKHSIKLTGFGILFGLPIQLSSKLDPSIHTGLAPPYANIENILLLSGMLLVTAVVILVSVGSRNKGTKGAQSVISRDGERGQGAEGASSNIGNWLNRAIVKLGAAVKAGRRVIDTAKQNTTITGGWASVNNKGEIEFAISSGVSSEESSKVGLTKVLSDEIIKLTGKTSDKFKKFIEELINKGMKEEELIRLVEIRKELVNKLSAATPEARERKTKNILPTEKQKDQDWFLAEGVFDQVIGTLLLNKSGEEKARKIVEHRVESILIEVVDDLENKALKQDLLNRFNEVAGIINNLTKGLSEQGRKELQDNLISMMDKEQIKQAEKQKEAVEQEKDRVEQEKDRVEQEKDRVEQEKDRVEARLWIQRVFPYADVKIKNTDLDRIAKLLKNKELIEELTSKRADYEIVHRINVTYEGDGVGSRPLDEIEQYVIKEMVRVQVEVLIKQRQIRLPGERAIRNGDNKERSDEFYKMRKTREYGNCLLDELPVSEWMKMEIRRILFNSVSNEKDFNVALSNLNSILEAAKKIGCDLTAFKDRQISNEKDLLDKFTKLENKLLGKPVIIYKRVNGERHALRFGGFENGNIIAFSGNDLGDVRKRHIAPSELFKYGEVIFVAEKEIVNTYFKDREELSGKAADMKVTEMSAANSSTSVTETASENTISKANSVTFENNQNTEGNIGGQGSFGGTGSGKGFGLGNGLFGRIFVIRGEKNSEKLTKTINDLIKNSKKEYPEETVLIAIIANNGSFGGGILSSKEGNTLNGITGKALVVIVNPDGTLTVKAYDSKAPPVANTESRTNSASSKNASPIALALIILNARETALQSGKETAAAQTKAQAESKEMNVEFVSLREALRKAGIAIIAVEVEDASIKSVIDDEHI